MQADTAFPTAAGPDLQFAGRAASVPCFYQGGRKGCWGWECRRLHQHRCLLMTPGRLLGSPLELARPSKSYWPFSKLVLPAPLSHSQRSISACKLCLICDAGLGSEPASCW